MIYYVCSTHWIDYICIYVCSYMFKAMRMFSRHRHISLFCAQQAARQFELSLLRANQEHLPMSWQQRMGGKKVVSWRSCFFCRCFLHLFFPNSCHVAHPVQTCVREFFMSTRLRSQISTSWKVPKLLPSAKLFSTSCAFGMMPC